MNADRGDAHVGVVAHGVDGAHYFVQLGRIVVVVGVQFGAVDGKVEVSLALQREHGVVGTDGGHHVGQGAFALPVRIDVDGCAATVAHQIAAPAGVGGNAHGGIVHPRLEVDGLAVVVALGGAVVALQLNGVGVMLVAVAQKYVVLAASVHYDGAQRLCVAVLVLNDGGEHQRLVGAYAHAVHGHAPGYHQRLAGRLGHGACCKLVHAVALGTGSQWCECQERCGYDVFD